MFTLNKKDTSTAARRGVVQTAHGVIETPFFMPVGTNGTVKSLTADDLEDLTAQLMLSNTYHLYLRPGMDVIREAGGLHPFMSWRKPILTDSGGYQVFSLSKLRKISDEGVEFRSHLDGSPHVFTPESVVQTQIDFGSDMMMPLDVCAPYPCGRGEAEQSVTMTTRWLKRSKDYFEAHKDKEQYLFGIIQGATFEDLRQRSKDEAISVPLDGYAIGGVSVGEPVKDMFETIEWIVNDLPEDKPRYLMGIGLPDQIVRAVGMGMDMFDTVLPTRFGRHGTAFTRRGKVNIRNAEFAKDPGPIDPECSCRVCRRYSRSYLRHLSNNGEISGLTLISYHNVYFYVNVMKDIRRAIDEDRYETFQEEFLRAYGSELLMTLS